MPINRNWLILAFATMCSALTVGSTTMIFTLFVHPWAEEFHAPLKDVMGIIALSMLVTGASGPVMGWLIDKIPARRLIAISATFFCIGLVLVSQAGALWQVTLLYASFIALGRMGAGANTTLALALRTLQHRRGLALGIVSMGPGIAGLIGPQIAVRLLQDVGWRDTHLILAAGVFVLIVPLAFLIIPRTAHSEAAHAAGSPAGEDKSVILDILKGKPYWGIAIGCLSLVALYTGMIHSIGPVTRELGFAATTTAMLLSTLHTTRLAVSTLFGMALDRFEIKWIFVFLVIAVVSGVWLFSIGSPVALVFAAAVVIGIVGGGLQPMLAAIVAQTYGSAAFGRAMGLVAVVTATGGAGAYVIGLLHDVFGTFELSLRVAILCLLPFSAAILLALRTKPQAAGATKPQVGGP